MTPLDPGPTQEEAMQTEQSTSNESDTSRQQNHFVVRAAAAGGSGASSGVSEEITFASGEGMAGVPWFLWLFPLIAFLLGTWQIFRWEYEVPPPTFNASEIH